MPIPAEFEEKDFERYFNDHIVVLDRQCWSPGQVMEGYIGFDGAAMLHPMFFDDALWIRRRRLPHLRRGVALDAGFVNSVFGVLDRHMPPYRFNFFAQHKRPTYVYGNNGGQRQAWGKPYYRYDIDGRQNGLLCKLEGVCGAGAIVSYCCPAFHTKKELWSANSSGQILQRTNYAPPSRLAHHHTYSFTDPGGRGKGHSEEEEINGKTLEEMVSLYKEANPPQPVSGLVRVAGKAIREAFAELGDDADFTREMAAQLAADVDRDGEGFSLVDAVAHIISLRFAFGTSLMLMGGEDKR